jgi:5-methylcytosine-specific restriction endonuclease McrA
MARPERHDADYFPLWNPTRETIRRINGVDLKDKFKAIRNSSGAFIAKPEVRSEIFSKCKSVCSFCGSNEDLEIDHVVSVYRAARGEFPIEKLNIRENLQLLCSICNSRKAP